MTQENCRVCQHCCTCCSNRHYKDVCDLCNDNRNFQLYLHVKFCPVSGVPVTKNNRPVVLIRGTGKKSLEKEISKLFNRGV